MPLIVWRSSSSSPPFGLADSSDSDDPVAGPTTELASSSLCSDVDLDAGRADDTLRERRKLGSGGSPRISLGYRKFGVPVGVIVDDVPPLDKGEPLSRGNSVWPALGVLEDDLAGSGDSDRGGVANPEEDGESCIRGWLQQHGWSAKELRNPVPDTNHSMVAHSPSVSVSTRFFKLGKVCRISRARRSRSAISFKACQTPEAS